MSHMVGDRRLDSPQIPLFVPGQVGDADIKNDAIQTAMSKWCFGEIFRQIGQKLLPLAARKLKQRQRTDDYSYAKDKGQPILLAERGQKVNRSLRSISLCFDDNVYM